MKTSDEDVVVAPRKRAPRKRAPAADGEVAVKPRTRRTSVRTEEAIPVRTHDEDEAPTRRAPTPIKAERTAAKKRTNGLLIGAAILLVGIGAGIGIGYLDRGPIDVVAVVNERNEKINRGEVRGENGEIITATVPVQSTDVRPNGGLVPADAPTPPPAPTPSIPLETGSSTEEAASSTDAASATSTTETTNS